MKFILTLSILITSLGFAEESEIINCISCKKECVDTMTVKDDESKPSKNITIWNRSICGNFHSYNQICKNDFYAYSSSDEKWILTLDNKDGFPIKLSLDIYNAPLAQKVTSLTVYMQEITNDEKIETLFFWFKTDYNYIQKVKKYCKDNNLEYKIDLNRKNEKSFIRIYKKTNS